jgi:hypothetical protein
MSTSEIPQPEQHGSEYMQFLAHVGHIRCVNDVCQEITCNNDCSKCIGEEEGGRG